MMDHNQHNTCPKQKNQEWNSFICNHELLKTWEKVKLVKGIKKDQGKIIIKMRSLILLDHY